MAISDNGLPCRITTWLSYELSDWPPDWLQAQPRAGGGFFPACHYRHSIEKVGDRLAGTKD